MAEEIEVKFLNVNLASLEAKLLEVGAEKVGDFFYRRRVFDYPDWRLDKAHSWLRLRDEGEKITLSFKKRLGAEKHDGTGNDDGMEETEIIVNDFEKTAQLLLSIGFIEKHYVENKRTRWTKEGVEFDIDIYPELEPYLEIESDSWQKIDEAIVWLGLNPEDKRIFSTNQIYKMKGVTVGDYIRITFEGLVKREKTD